MKSYLETIANSSGHILMHSEYKIVTLAFFSYFCSIPRSRFCWDVKFKYQNTMNAETKDKE